MQTAKRKESYTTLSENAAEKGTHPVDPSKKQRTLLLAHGFESDKVKGQQ
jgi:hypothetical protein